MESTPIVEMRNVSKAYGAHQVLREANLDIFSGDMLSITGRSGSGKSTLLHLIAGLDRDYTGTVKVFGQDLKPLSETLLGHMRNQEIGFVFQSFHLIDHLTCHENILLPHVFSEVQMSPAKASARADEVLEQVGLADQRNKRPTALSGGQKQRIAIARALFFRPQLLLCDEPTGNLDSTTTEAILNLFRSLQKSNNVTLVLVSHNPMVLKQSQRVVHVIDGKIS